MKKIYASFVFPSEVIGGKRACGQACPHCILEQRDDLLNQLLTPDQYVAFAKDMLEHFQVTAMSIESEALSAQAWPLTQQLLPLFKDYGVPCAIVTNGMELAARAHDLPRLLGRMGRVVVSLDGANAERHDQLRGTVGAFQRAMEGIRAAVSLCGDRVSVNSVLFPGRAGFLTDFPELFTQLRVKRWYITPFINLKGRNALPDVGFIESTLTELLPQCTHRGIDLILSDETGSLALTPAFRRQVEVNTLTDLAFFRLLPSGACPGVTEMFVSANEAENHWDGNEPSYCFLKRMFKNALQGKAQQHRPRR